MRSLAKRQRAKDLILVFGEGGGYLPAPSHNIQATVPPQSVEAMFPAFDEYRDLFQRN